MSSTRIYEINYGTLVWWLIPPKLRNKKLVNWLLVLISPVAAIKEQFKLYQKAKRFQLAITPQVCYLEFMLNDSFDSSLRRIRIGDANWFSPIDLYIEPEQEPVPLYKEPENKPLKLYLDSEAGMMKDDFVVLVPAGLSYNVEEMKGKLDAYKLAATKYTIQAV